jgi:hypothetical protein
MSDAAYDRLSWTIRHSVVDCQATFRSPPNQRTAVPEPRTALPCVSIGEFKASIEVEAGLLVGRMRVDRRVEAGRELAPR